MGGLVLAILLVALLMFLLKPKSFNIDVGISVLRAMSSVAIMSLGLTLVIVVGEIDLSFGAMYGLGANSLAVMWIAEIPIYAALPLAIGVGRWSACSTALLSLAQHSLVHRHARHLQPALWRFAVDHQNVDLQPGLSATGSTAQLDFFTGLTASFGAHPISLEVVWMLGLALTIGFLLHRTLFGFRLMAIGGNPVAAQLARLPVTRYKILAFVICSMLAAAAGILDFSFIQTTQPNIGLSFTFPVFAAVIIGGASLSGGKGTVIGAMSGALLLAELQQGLALLSPGPHVQQLFLGFVTIGAVALDLALTNIRKRRAA